MAESIFIPDTQNRKEVYEALLPQVKGVISGETNLVANLANVAAILKEAFDFFWVGFYLVDSEEELVLGPFQGPLACTRIKKGKGVCGSAWEQNQTLLVDDVEQFPGHIACSSLSKSEIVLPLYNEKDEVVGVLDIDSDKLADFSAYDKNGLEEVVQLLKPLFT